MKNNNGIDKFYENNIRETHRQLTETHGNQGVGQIFSYSCGSCGFHARARKRHGGISPVIRQCPKCDKWELKLLPTDEFKGGRNKIDIEFVLYRPTPEDLIKSDDLRMHVDIISGGLILKKIK